MKRSRRTMLQLTPVNTTNDTFKTHEDDFVWLSSPNNDFPPQSRAPDEQRNGGGGHKNSISGDKAAAGATKLPLLVVVACVVIPALIAAAIVFAFIKYKKSKHGTGGGIHYIECDGKSGQLNKAYKTPFDTSSVCYEKPNEVKLNHKGTSTRQGQPTKVKIPISSCGGLFCVKQAKTFLSIPRNLTTLTEEIHIGFNTENSLPDFVVPENVLSDIITLLPHNATFSGPILVRLPVDMSKVKDTKNIQLMYSCTGEGEKPAWINLPSSNKNIRHLDPIFWFLIGGECYLFTSHFCHVFVTQFCSVLEQQALFLQASVHSDYDDELKEVKLHVGFHCGKCNPDILKGKHEYGTLVGKCYKCIYGREGCVKVRSELTDPSWKATITEMDIETGDLLNLCNLDDIFPPLTFVYRPDTGPQVKGTRVIAQVNILQGERKPITIQGSVRTSLNQSKKLQPLSVRKASDPVEHVDLSCSPREHSEDMPALRGVLTNGISGDRENSPDDKYYEENSSNTSTTTDKNSEKSNNNTRLSDVLRIALQSAKVNNNKENMSLPAVFSQQETPKFIITEPKRNGGSIFEEHVRYEEKELCKLLDEKTDQLLTIAEEIGLSKDLCITRNFDGQRILQIWKILVITHQKTWIDLHSALVRMKMVDAAHQLKMAYEKDLMI